MKLALTLFGTVVAALGLFEVMMQPSAAERTELGVILAGMALLALGVARLLPALARRLESIRHTMALLAMAGFAIVVIGTLAVGSRMFLSDHDLQLLLVVLAFGVLATVIFGVAVSRPLAADIDSLSERAALIANGNLDSRVDVRRRDEVGKLATSLAMMIDELEQAEASRAADEEARRVFFSSVGHDLRTPLASLRVSVEAIQDGIARSPTESLSIMQRDIEAMSRLVDDLNLLARIDSGSLEFDVAEIDITEVADEALDVVRPLAMSKQIRLRLMAPKRVNAVAHPGHLGRVFRNLIDNAVRHSPESSEVVIELTQQSGSAVVMVTDQGPGFDPDFAHSAFDRFTRAEPSRRRDGSGSGLGLAIVEGLVEALNGQVWIEAGPGGRVGIELPAESSVIEPTMNRQIPDGPFSPAERVGHP